MGTNNRDKHDGDGSLSPAEQDIPDRDQTDEDSRGEEGVTNASAGPDDRPSDPIEPTNPA